MQWHWLSPCTILELSRSLLTTDGISLGGGGAGRASINNCAKFLGNTSSNWNSNVTLNHRWCCYCQKQRNGEKSCTVINSWSYSYNLGSLCRYLHIILCTLLLAWMGGGEGQVPSPPRSSAYNSRIRLMKQMSCTIYNKEGRYHSIEPP